MKTNPHFDYTAYSLQILLLSLLLSFPYQVLAQCSSVISNNSSGGTTWSSTNMYTIGQNNTQTISYDPVSDAVAFIYRQNTALFGGNSGMYRMSYSLNGGTTWSDQAMGNNFSNYLGRFPNLVLYNANQSANPASTNQLQVAYLGSSVSSSGGFNGYISGRKTLNSGTSTQLSANQTNPGTMVSFVQSTPGTFWSVNNFTDNTNLVNGIRVYKGSWNIGTSSISWIMQDSIILNTYQASLPNIAFDPSGQIGWISLVGDLGAVNNVYSPIFIQSNDGGTTWSAPQEVHLFYDTYYTNGCILSTIMNAQSGSMPSTSFEHDLTVDYLGQPHMLTSVTANLSPGMTPYNVYFGIYNAMVDITYHNNHWNGVYLAQHQAGRAVYGTAPNTLVMDMQPQISRTEDGKQIGYGWVDDQAVTLGDAPVSPHLMVCAVDLPSNQLSTVINAIPNASCPHYGQVRFPHLSDKMKDLNNRSVQFYPVFSNFLTNPSAQDPLLAVSLSFLDDVIIDDTLFTSCYLEDLHQTVNSCGPYTWAANGQTYSSSGVYFTYAFTTCSNVCPVYQTLDLTITNPTIQPQFSFDTVVCPGQINSPLPLVSDNNIPGTWYPPFDNQNSTTYTFVPDSGYCAFNAEVTLTIGGTTPVFNFATTTFCLGDVIPPLPSISSNGITGSWTPALNPNASTTYTFLPDTGQCANTIIQTLNILQTVGQHDSVTACNTFTWPANGQSYTSSGIYYATNSCATDTLTLLIENCNTNCINHSLATNSGTYTELEVVTELNGELYVRLNDNGNYKIARWKNDSAWVIPNPDNGNGVKQYLTNWNGFMVFYYESVTGNSIATYDGNTWWVFAIPINGPLYCGQPAMNNNVLYLVAMEAANNWEQNILRFNGAAVSVLQNPGSGMQYNDLTVFQNELYVMGSNSPNVPLESGLFKESGNALTEQFSQYELSGKLLQHNNALYFSRIDTLTFENLLCRYDGFSFFTFPKLYPSWIMQSLTPLFSLNGNLYVQYTDLTTYSEEIHKLDGSSFQFMGNGSSYFNDQMVLNNSIFFLRWTQYPQLELIELNSSGMVTHAVPYSNMSLMPYTMQNKLLFIAHGTSGNAPNSYVLYDPFTATWTAIPDPGSPTDYGINYPYTSIGNAIYATYYSPSGNNRLSLLLPGILPHFTIADTLCSGINGSPLPDTSLNGITGTWSPVFNPNIAQTYTFIPDTGQCALAATHTVVMVPCGGDSLQMTIFHEGYYSGGGQMQPVLFNSGSSASTQFCDSLQVEIHQAISPYLGINTIPALVDLQGNVSIVIPPNLEGGTYYLSLRFRNGVETWSSTPITFTTNTTYNFTTSASQAYGANQIEVSPGIWAMYTGDINQDGVVDGLDYNDWEFDNNNFASGYFSTDLNGDGIVDGLDFLLWEVNNNNFVGVVSP